MKEPEEDSLRTSGEPTGRRQGGEQVLEADTRLGVAPPALPAQSGPPLRPELAGRELVQKQQGSVRFLEKRVMLGKVSQHPARQPDRGSVSTCCLFWESEIPY